MASSDRRIPGLVGRSALEFAVVSNPATPDRTAAIRGLAPSPLPYLIESARLLERLGASHIAYPCNTAHYFLHNAMDELALRVPLVDMIDETVRAVAGAGLSRVGLLATTGTISTGLYQHAFETSGIATLVPGPSPPAPGSADLDAEGRVRPEVYARMGIEPGRAVDAGRLATLVGFLVDILGEQEGLVMEAIRGPYGVKAGYAAGLPAQLAAEAGHRLVGRGADALVLGCTELPLVLRGREAAFGSRSVPLVDSTTVVAERLLALDGRHGIAGGLGPEATIDLLVKMHAPADFTDLQYDILRSTIADLGARRDQDHLKLVALATPDPVDAARRLAEVGASFLVLTRTAADARDAVATATKLTTLVDRPDSPVGHEVVRRATGLLATP